MADEFDPAEFETAKPDNGGFDPAEFAASKGPPVSSGRAGLEAFLSGVSADWRDEIYGASKASGLPEVVGGFRAPIGAARLAYEHFTGQPGEASKVYDEAVAHMREIQKAAKAQHPYIYGASNLAGSVVGMTALPGSAVVQGAKFVPRVGQAIKSGATVGAEYGALSGAGEGEGLQDTAIGMGTGAATGLIGGGLGGAVGDTIGATAKAGYDYFGRPIAGIIRGLRNPEEEALRRGAGAIMTGQENVVAGKSLGMTPQEWLAAKSRGEPVMLADLGGESGRALARSAANTDPEGRALITTAAQDRFEGQNERAGQLIRGLVSGGADAFKRSEELLADYNKWRKPLYDVAYKTGDRPLWSPELERLAGIPAVEGALKSAVTTGANRAGAEGYGAFNPGVKVTPDGQLLFSKGKNGIPTYPNLQFWDYAYRDLRDKAGAAFRAGEKDHGSALNTLANNMRSELDNLVPQYGTARGFAARYFGGDNALEAGANAVKFKGDPRELQANVAKIKDPRERALFTEGYVSELANRMESVPDRNDITKRIFQSPQDRKRIEAVLGQQRTAALQTFLDRETIYDALRKSLGNSTTARQLIEAGLAGGGIGAYLGNGDPRAVVEGITGGIAGGSLGVAGGMRHGVATMTRAGAEKVIGYVDRNTARRVAEFLTSDDPQKLMKGLALVQKNPKIAPAMRDLADRVSIASGTKALPKLVPSLPRLQAPGTAGADENQPEIPRPPAQQKDGGRVNQQHDAHGHAHGGAVDDSRGGTELGREFSPVLADGVECTQDNPIPENQSSERWEDRDAPPYADGGGVPQRHPFVAGARLAKDGNHYVPDPSRAGKYMMVRSRARHTG